MPALDFEQPIAELQAKIDELRYVHEDSAADISAQSPFPPPPPETPPARMQLAQSPFPPPPPETPPVRARPRG